MRSTHLFASAALVYTALGTALAIGCGPAEGSCAIDTDCPLGQRCSGENLCVPLGGGGADAGTRDAGPRDAAVADANIDASSPVDASSGDAGPVTCDTFAGTYVVGELSATCGTIAVGQSIVATNVGAGAGCTLVLAPSDVGAPVLEGSVTLDESAAFTGTMLSVAGDPMNVCAGTFSLTGLDVTCTHSVTSEACMLGFARAP